MRAVLACLVAIASSAAAADADLASRIRSAGDLNTLVGTLQAVEESSAAALAEADAQSYNRQRRHIGQILGRISQIPTASEDARAACTGAAASLDHLLIEVALPEDQVVAATERNARQWSRDMAECEQATGLNRPRKLK